MNPTDLSPFKSDPAAAGVLAHLAAAKWRKARDAAKELFKKDKVKYAPLLIAANIGLAEEMLDRGLTEDAASVITYLRTIAPPAVVESLLTRRNQVKSAAVIARGSPAEVLATAWGMVSQASAEGPHSTKLINAADRLALCPELPAGTDAPELRAEWAAVRRAVDATANGDWQSAKTALRGISAQSVFGGWRLFLRGVRCVHTGELETARQCFTALPAGTATARAAWAYRLACGLPGGPDQPPPAARAIHPSVLCGASAKAASAIAEADALWRKNDLVGAWSTLVPGFGRADFPSETPGLAGTLTRLFLANPFKKLLHAGDMVPLFWDWMERRVARPGGIPPLEEMLLLVQIMRLGGPDGDGGEVMDWAERIVELDTQLHGSHPLRAAAVWELAAASLPEDDGLPAFPGLGRRPDPERDMHGLRTEALRRCMELDPGHPARTLALLKHLASQPRTRNELAKAAALAAERFPDHPGILATAGQALLEAGGKEALELLRRARRLDPGDTETEDLLFERLEKETAKKSRISPALWEELEALAKPAPATLPDTMSDLNPGRLRWFVGLRRAVADPLTAKKTEALRTALTAAPSVFLGNLALSIIQDVESMGKETAAFPSMESAQGVTWQDLAWVPHLFHWRWRQRTAVKGAKEWREGLDHWLCQAVTDLLNPRTLVPEGNAKAVLALAKGIFTLNQSYYMQPMETLPNALILEVAKTVADPIGHHRSYQLALASILLPVSCRGNRMPCSCQKLAAIARSAKDAGDMKSAQLAERLIDQCGALPAPSWTKPRGKKAKAKKNAAKKAAAKKVVTKKSAAGTAPPQEPVLKKAPAKKKKVSAPQKRWMRDDAEQLIKEFIAKTQGLDQPDLFGGQ